MDAPSGSRKRATALAVLCAWFAVDADAAVTVAQGTPAPGTTEGRFAAAADEALARIAEPRGVDALLRMSMMDDSVPDALFERRLDELAAARNPHPSVGVLARYLQAKLARRLEGHGPAEEAFARQGFVQEWSLVGPFDNEGRKGFTTAYPPETETLDAVVLDHVYDGKERPVHWLPAETHVARVTVERYLYPLVSSCIYGYAVVRAPRPTDARVWTGADGSVTVWVGGREALAEERYFSAFPDREAADVRLPKGPVPVLVKACGEGAALAFYFRVTDRAGRPIPGLVFERRLRDGETPLDLAADPVPWETAGFALVRAAEAEAATAEDRLLAGRTLFLSSTIDATDNQAQKLLEKAVEDLPTAEAYYWLMLASTDNVKAGRAADELAVLAGGQAYLLAEAAARRLTFLSVRAADPISQRAMAAPGGDDDPTVVLVRALLLQYRGLAGACTALVADWLAAHTPTPALLEQQRTCLLAEGRTDEAQAIAATLERDDRADADLPLARLQRMATRGETDAARALAAELVAEFPDDLGTLQQVAASLLAAGAGDEAVALLRRLGDESPQNPSVVLALGRTLEQLGRRDEAVEPYRRALELEPQNQPLAQYLDFLDDRQSIEDRWAVDVGELQDAIDAARTALEDTRPEEQAKLRKARALFRQEVNQIHPNGLSSRFGQWFTLVQTADGAEQARSTYVPFTPGEEDFELLRAIVYKPDGHTEDYETHYPVSYGGGIYFSDAGAEAISFPRLGVGDVLEVRYRIDGRSRQNKFGEHFSNEVGILTFDPTDRFRYALVAPESKALYVHLPEDFRFTSDERSENGERVRIYEATNLPAIPDEPGSPPYPELAQAIQVSTFQDWHELARWWWGLVKDQLQPDETIRQRVAEITAGATTTEEIVARVFDWVIRNTRYVALEFGIHGWKPYRAHEVVSRGFGDCKDKGSLIYTMLAAAGVDARLVLLRTRYYRGRSVSEFPSLGQFDHLITYIPALDLFVDGTMTLSSYTELPAMDREAFALVIGPDDERTVTTPLEPRQPDLLTYEFEHDVRPDGSASTHGVLRAVGAAYAPGLRGRLQAAETRKQRAEELAGQIYSGLVLGEFTVEGLDDFRAPVVFTGDAEIPQLATGGGGTFSLRADRPLNLASSWAGADRRELDVEMGQAIHEQRTVVYRLPSTAQEVRVPEGRTLSDGERSFVMEVTRNGNAVTVTWKLVVPDPRVPVAEYPAFRAFCAAVDTALAEPITYVVP
jgi:tetratricopeptide (TPR) repeat protein